MTTLSALLALAEKATPGPYTEADFGIWGNRDSRHYLRQCSPEVVAALCRVAMAAKDGTLGELDDALCALDAALDKGER